MSPSAPALSACRSRFSRDLCTGFFFLICVCLGAAVLSYKLSALFPDLSCRVRTPFVTGTPYALFLSILESQGPAMFSLVVLFLASFTMLEKAAAVFLSLWRGACLGCALRIGAGLSHMAFTLTLFFFSTALILLLASYAAIYSECFLQSSVTRSRRQFFALFGSFLRCYLTLSGCILLTGVLSLLML